MKIILFLFSAAVFAKTEYTFIKNESNPKNDTCVERDIKTKGGEYQIKVNKKHCIPKDPGYLFDFQYGRCYLVDKETLGKGFIVSASLLTDCKTENTQTGYITIKKISGCFSYDLPTQGKKYYKKISESKCSTEAEQYFWIPESKFKGECKRSEETTSGKSLIKVAKERCRPTNFIYKFHKESSNFFTGKCYEVHPKKPENYARVVSNELCRPQSTLYIFYREEGKTQGKCYELDTLTKGEQYIDTVKANFCKENLK